MREKNNPDNCLLAANYKPSIAYNQFCVGQDFTATCHLKSSILQWS